MPQGLQKSLRHFVIGEFTVSQKKGQSLYGLINSVPVTLCRALQRRDLNHLQSEGRAVKSTIVSSHHKVSLRACSLSRVSQDVGKMTRSIEQKKKKA